MRLGMQRMGSNCAGLSALDFVGGRDLGLRPRLVCVRAFGRDAEARAVWQEPQVPEWSSAAKLVWGACGLVVFGIA